MPPTTPEGDDPDGEVRSELDRVGFVFGGDRYIREAFEQVPSIGEGHRWYDYPYKALKGLQFSRVGQRSPQWARTLLSTGWIALSPIAELERARAWSRDDHTRNLVVPDDDHVHIPGIWVSEFFPPSEVGNLNRAIVRNDWNKTRMHFGLGGETVQEALAKSRQGSGWNWVRMGASRSEWSTLHISDAIRRKLPSQFEEIEHFALQVGGGLTVVISYFGLSKEGQQEIDRAWHGPHEPRVIRVGGRRVVEDRLWSAFGETQEVRQNLHRLARGWMAERCPGFFASNDERQPLMDLLLLDKYDPAPGGRPSRELDDSLRALGIIGPSTHRLSSPQVPGLLLERVDERLCPTMKGKTTWTLWGQIDKASAIRNDLRNYPNELPRAIGHSVNDRVRDVFLRLSMSDFLRLKAEQNAAMRDNARAHHGKFGKKDLNQLRDIFLTSSLDTTSLSRDIDEYIQREGRFSTAHFFRSLEPWHARRELAEGEEQDAPTNLLSEIMDEQSKRARELVEFDQDYRDILSTVASLGSSIYAFRVQKYTVAIALLSIGIAVIALLSEDARVAFGEWLWSWVTLVWPFD